MSAPLPIYVINLDRSPERWAAMQAQLARHGLEATRISAVDGKVNLVASVSKDLTKRFQAGKLIQEVAKLVGGGGGGRPDLAQAGGKDPSKLDEALSGVPAWVERVAQS